MAKRKKRKKGFFSFLVDPIVRGVRYVRDLFVGGWLLVKNRMIELPTRTKFVTMLGFSLLVVAFSILYVGLLDMVFKVVYNFLIKRGAL